MPRWAPGRRVEPACVPRCGGGGSGRCVFPPRSPEARPPSLGGLSPPLSPSRGVKVARRPPPLLLRLSARGCRPCPRWAGPLPPLLAGGRPPSSLPPVPVGVVSLLPARGPPIPPGGGVRGVPGLPDVAPRLPVCLGVGLPRPPPAREPRSHPPARPRPVCGPGRVPRVGSVSSSRRLGTGVSPGSDGWPSRFCPPPSPARPSRPSPPVVSGGVEISAVPAGRPSPVASLSASLPPRSSSRLPRARYGRRPGSSRCRGGRGGKAGVVWWVGGPPSWRRCPGRSSVGRGTGAVWRGALFA